MTDRSAADDGLSTDDVVCRLRDALLGRRTTILAARLGSFRGELIRKVADLVGVTVAEWFLFGKDALDPGLPEMVSDDPVESGLRQLLLSAGSPETAVPESNEQLVSLAPGWYSALSENAGGVLLLRDLVPPNKPDDDRLERLSKLLHDRSYAGCDLPAEVGVMLTTDPTAWPSYRLEGFASSVGADLVPWRGAASTPEDFEAMIRSADNREDPLAHVDIASILAKCP